MEIGCAVGALRTGPAAGKLPLLRAVGIQHIEVQFGTDAEDVENASFMGETREALAATGLRVWSCHSPFGPEVEVSSSDERVRERGVAAVIRSARGCVELGAKVLVVHCGEHHADEGSRLEALRRAPASVARIVAACSGLGVQVALENLPPGYVTCAAAELLSVVQLFPPTQVGVCVDIGHAHIGGDAAGLVRAVASRIITTHIHDNDGKTDQHYVPWRGTIDWRAVGAALATSPYFRSPNGLRLRDGGPIMFEVSGPGSHAEAISALPAAGEMLARLIAAKEGR